jgi:hypothetical protein
MDKNNGNGKKPNSNSHQILDNFYKEAIRITRFNREEIKDILVGNFGDKFDSSRVPEYVEFLRIHAEERNSKEALNNMREKLRGRIPEMLPPNPCPIPGCKGVMKWDRHWQWVCSDGGLRHRLAHNTSLRIGIPADEMVKKLDALHDARRTLQDTETKLWRKRINEPIEPQGWHIAKEEPNSEETSGAYQDEDAPEIPNRLQSRNATEYQVSDPTWNEQIYLQDN